MSNEFTSKSLIYYAIIVFIFFIIFDFLFGLSVKYYLNKYGNIEINYINNFQPHYVVLGSSTSKYSINPKYFNKKTYNASKNGEGFIYSYMMFKNLDKNKIKEIIISIDPIDLINDYKDKESLSNLLKLIYFNNNYDLKKIISKNLNYINYLKFSNLYNFKFFPYFVLDQIRFNNNKNYFGYTKLNGSVLKDENIETFDKNSCTKRIISKTNLKLLNEIFRLSKEKNISLIFHVTPIYLNSGNTQKIFRSYDQCNKNIINKISKMISENNQCNLMVNYPKEFIDFSKNKFYFYDRAHINSNGAITYSNILQRWINENC